MGADGIVPLSRVLGFAARVRVGLAVDGLAVEGLGSADRDLRRMGSSLSSAELEYDMPCNSRTARCPAPPRLALGFAFFCATGAGLGVKRDVGDSGSELRVRASSLFDFLTSLYLKASDDDEGGVTVGLRKPRPVGGTGVQSESGVVDGL